MLVSIETECIEFSAPKEYDTGGVNSGTVYSQVLTNTKLY